MEMKEELLKAIANFPYGEGIEDFSHPDNEEVFIQVRKKMVDIIEMIQYYLVAPKNTMQGILTVLEESLDADELTEEQKLLFEVGHSCAERSLGIVKMFRNDCLGTNKDDNPS